MEETTGELFEIRDHADLSIFEKHLADFRSWMAQRGYQNTPLAVTEFGILLPADYGFEPHVVANFLLGAAEIMNQATSKTGYPADEYRLVQWWFWFSVYNEVDFPSSNLYNPDTDQLTQAGKNFSHYLGPNLVQ
jgi:hypothetical protein